MASEKLIHEHHFAAAIAVAVTILLGFIGVTAKASMQNDRALSRTLMVLSLWPNPWPQPPRAPRAVPLT